MQFAPIIVFAFNRLNPLKACLTALKTNAESKDSDLIVFVDGPRSHKFGETETVEAVRDYVKKINGFKSLTYHFSKENKGLGPSIVAGVSEIIRKYGRAIVLEDDLIVSENFLAFMNQGLEKYEKNKEVFSVCGYTNIVKIPKDYSYDAYFCVRSSSWGWATWKDRWDSVDWDLKNWSKVEKNARTFNRWGGSDCYGMLKGWKEGRNKSWAIRFCYAQFVQNKLSLFPIISKIDNEGFDGEGTNCKSWSRYKFDFDRFGKKKFKLPEMVIMNKSLCREALKYYSIPIRIYSRFMYIYTDIKNKLKK